MVVDEVNALVLVLRFLLSSASGALPFLALAKAPHLITETLDVRLLKEYLLKTS